MTKTSALKVGSKLEWDCYCDDEPGIILTVTHLTKGKVFLERFCYVDGLVNSVWSRRALNSTPTIRVLSV